MTHTFNLQRLLELVERQSETAAASLGTLNRELACEQEKLTLLIRYRTEYQQRLLQTIGQGVDGAGLRNFHQFLERLEQAIAQQQIKVADSQKHAAVGRVDWQAKQRKHKAFDTLSQRFQAAVRQRETNQEQRLLDEFAVRSYRRRGAHR